MLFIRKVVLRILVVLTIEFLFLFVNLFTGYCEIKCVRVRGMRGIFHNQKNNRFRNIERVL